MLPTPKGTGISHVFCAASHVGRHSINAINVFFIVIS